LGIPTYRVLPYTTKLPSNNKEIMKSEGKLGAFVKKHPEGWFKRRGEKYIGNFLELSG
jgi:hypothetical protein